MEARLCLQRKLQGNRDLQRFIWEFVQHDVHLHQVISSFHRIYRLSPCIRLPFSAKDVTEEYLLTTLKHDHLCCWFCGACRPCSQCSCPEGNPLNPMTTQVHKLFDNKFGTTKGKWYNAYDEMTGVLYHDQVLSPQNNVSGVYECIEIHYQNGNWFLQGRIYVNKDSTRFTVSCQSKT